MFTVDSALGKALALSLLLHGLLLAGGTWLIGPMQEVISRQKAQLEVALLPREPEAPPLFVDEEPQPVASPAPRPHRVAKPVRERPPADPRRTLAGEAARQANIQLAQQLFYPPEAIARGLEGEALVLLFLNASGDVIAARLEASSGHRLLDDAAVRAARTLHSLPDSAPREALLPVRFRLR